MFYRSLSGHDITANPLQRYSIYSRRKKAFSCLQQKEGGKIWRCLSFQLLICQIHWSQEDWVRSQEGRRKSRKRRKFFCSIANYPDMISLKIQYSAIAYIAEGRRRLVIYNRRKEENLALSEFSAFDMSNNTLIGWKKPKKITGGSTQRLF
ncbi:MAG: hypothetical protein F6K23_28510 [Okeania sp. SIO2C9]|uniref:hypothetical protein n=1 Tax=Okeania sp. SIO2C9 TaxID=2607791 RepID=UPI0013C08CF0|nr:hypothetical protein [Okeania sp. SIO2C9]NEQ76633.1 hypothetical protein [Okeania sp. SIO2C9]